MMLKTFSPTSAAIISAIIMTAAFLIGLTLQKVHNNYCKKYANVENIENAVSVKSFCFKVLILTVFALSGFYLGNLINIGTTFYTAVSHGMVVDSETGKYEFTYGEMMELNHNSVRLSKIDPDNLANTALIFVRYDCADCIILHEQLSAINDIPFVSSRTETGLYIREKYNINLTEIPQGVYIDSEGNATVIKITQGTGDDYALDLQQIASLRQMTQ